MTAQRLFQSDAGENVCAVVGVSRSEDSFAGGLMTVEERIAYLVSTSETLVAQLRDLKSLNELIQKASAPADTRKKRQWPES